MLFFDLKGCYYSLVRKLMLQPLASNYLGKIFYVLLCNSSDDLSFDSLHIYS